MQVDIAEHGTLGKKLSISYTPDEVRARRDRVLRELSGKVKLPGFRPGKSTAAVVEKRFGDEAAARAEEELANEGLSKAVTDKGLKPIGPMKNLESKREQGLRLVFAFEVRPAVTLPDPKSLEIPREEIAIPDSEVDEAVASMARRAGTLSPLAEGETIAADDSLSLSGKVTVGGAVARELHDFKHLVGAYPLLGKKPEEVVSLFAGKKVGDAVTYDTTLPQSFAPAEFAGKAASVAVTVQTATRNRAAVIDDAFAKQLGVADVAAMKEALKKNLLGRKEEELHRRQLDALVKALIAKTPVELPPQLHAAILADRVAAAEKAAETEAKDKPADEVAKAKAEAAEKAKAEAEESLKRYIILSTAAEQHSVQVSREDLEQQLRMAAGRSGQTVEAISKRLMDSGRLNDVVEEIKEAKTLEAVLELALAK
jgi:trigger factor